MISVPTPTFSEPTIDGNCSSHFFLSLDIFQTFLMHTHKSISSVWIMNTEFYALNFLLTLWVH